MNRTIKALVLGDVIGKPGCRALFIGLKELKSKTNATIVIANGENVSDGRGITSNDVEALFKYGVDVITSGNHIWQKKDIFNILESEDCLLRPENYPNGAPGKGHCIINLKDIPIGVLNLEGRVFLSNLRCPFRVAKEIAAYMRKKTRIIIVDFHAESTEEKEALGIYLDGKVSAVVGTHTHIQTADQRILPGGTGYITDIGMTGPEKSIIGMSIETGIKRCLTQMPLKMEIVDEAASITGVLIEIDISSGRTLSIKRVKEKASI